jgi:hypothetical protein
LQEELERLQRESDKADETPSRDSEKKVDKEDEYWNIPF